MSFICIYILTFPILCMDFPSDSDGKESACNAGDSRDESSIHGSGRSPGEGNGNPLQYSCLRNSVDGGAWWASVHGVTRVRHDIATKTTTETTDCCMHSTYFFLLVLHK